MNSYLKIITILLVVVLLICCLFIKGPPPELDSPFACPDFDSVTPTSLRNNVHGVFKSVSLTEGEKRDGAVEQIKDEKFSSAADSCNLFERKDVEFETVLKGYDSSGVTPIGCGATVVGPRTVLTAAHCVKVRSRTYVFKIVVQKPDIAGGPANYESKDFFGICQPHPNYYQDADPAMRVDIALCKLDRDIVGIKGGKFESISIAPLPPEYVHPQSKKHLMFAGYGDNDPLSIGLAPIDNVYACYTYPSCNLPNGEWQKECKIDVNRICTKARCGVNPDFPTGPFPAREAKTVKGDSGGPLFLLSRKVIDERKIVGVASQAHRSEHISIFAATSRPEISPFIEYWAKQCGKICGVNIDSADPSCR